MIDYQTFLKIKYLQQHAGLKCSQIAAKLGLDDRTVGKWLKEKQFRQRQSTPHCYRRFNSLPEPSI
jgi:DNA-binding transcriptional regulator LsrR (DeoR family)